MNEATILKPPELVDRYLGAVGALLPAGQRSEVLAEVRDVLLSRMDERQTQFGHPLSTQEAEEVLNGYGHPVAVALDQLGAGHWLAQWFGHMVATWRPRDLPAPVAPPPAPPAAGWTLLWDFIGLGLILLWVTGALDAMLAPLTAVTHIRPAAILLPMRWPLLALAAADTSIHILAALKALPALRTVLQVAVHLAAVLLLGVLLVHWPLVEGLGVSPAAAASTARRLSIGLGIAWALVALTAALQALRSGRRPGDESP